MRQSGDGRRRVLVVGAGVAGIVAAIRLRDAGAEVVVVEKADRLGGTWRDNTYPGVACDVPSHLYSYSFAPNPGWSHTFAPGEEIQAYLEQVAAEHGVDQLVRYGTEVVRLVDDGIRWTAETKGGEVLRADVVIAATGVLHHPHLPEIEGLDRFAGDCFHSARWRHDTELDGRRVGIVGSGSSAVQIVTAIAERVGELHLFQRTPQWVLPMANEPIEEDERALLAGDPAALAERRAYLAETFEASFADVVIDASSPQLEVIAELCRANLESNVADPELRERLRPDHRAACKRLIVSDGYYRAVSRPNVRLVTEPIVGAGEAGLRTSGGTLHELDVLVLATGFRVDRFLRPIEVVAADGTTLEEVWAERPSAYLGISIPQFPNLFLVNGPNGPVGNFSLIEVAELQLGYILQLLDLLDGADAEHEAPRRARLAATPEALERFEAARVEAARRTVWSTGCKSWYLDDRGVPAAWPWTFGRFRRAMAAPNLAHFALQPARSTTMAAATT